MSADEGTPTWLERLVAGAAWTLEGMGLRRLASSSASRRLGKALLRRSSDIPAVRVIPTGLGRGMKLRVFRETPKSHWLGTHEPQMQAALAKHVRPGMTVYDCGANIGFFSVLLSRLVGAAGHVYAFEPSPASLESLRAAVELNRLTNLTVVPKGLWDERRTLRFRRGSAGASLVTDHVEGVFGGEPEQTCETAADFLEIEVDSLDNFVYAEGCLPPDFVKIDVEGAEGKALTGARRLLAEHRPGLLLEIHGEPGREVWQVLQESGYTATNIDSGAIPKSDDEFAVWISQYLALPS